MKACITLDLEPDHAGRIAPAYTAWDRERVGRMLDLLAAHRAPLSAFVVAGSLEAVPGVIERFQQADTEFHLHSYSHDLAHPDSASEIGRGQEAFARLDAEGFRFDSSIFPSFWPRPHYATFPRRPYRPAGVRLVEMPIATVTPARIIVSLSWMKLLGWPVFRRLLDLPLPDPLVFDMHLHDLWALPSKTALKAPWSWIYARNADAGFPILEAFLAALRAKGYELVTIGQAAHEAAAALAAAPGDPAAVPAVRAS